jgi:DNA-binding NarL/FixJ family response regulator
MGGVTMSEFMSAVGLEALSRAREADGHTARYRGERDQAVVEALAAGISIEQIADELGVRIAEIDEMVAAAGRRRVTMRSAGAPAATR